MKISIKFIVSGLWIMFATAACFHDDDGTTPVGSCSGAQEYYDYAESLHREAQEKLHFGSTWEVSYKVTYNRQARYYRYLQLFVAGPLDDRMVGTRDYEGTTDFTFTMPAGPTPLSCSEVQEIKDYMGEDTGMMHELIMFEYYFRFMEAFPYNGIPVTGSGNHHSREEPSFTTDRIIETPLACSFDNPCAQDRVEELGCTVPPRMHSVDAHVSIGWYPGEDATFWVAIDDYTPVGTSATQVERSGNPDVEVVIGDPNDLCTFYNPICLGTETRDVSCGVGFQRFDRNFPGDPDIILQPLQVQDYSVTNSYGDVRTRQVRLECVDGCECVTDNDCDDGVVCTRDSCNAGNCDNIPDDTIRPEQVDNDCRTCVNGEVFSMRETAERECEAGKSTTVEICSTSDNWIVHWVKEFGGPTEQAHFCHAGVVPGDSELTICNGQGQCTVGQPVTTIEAMIDRSCQNYAGQSVQLVCDVLCTRCE